MELPVTTAILSEGSLLKPQFSMDTAVNSHDSVCQGGQQKMLVRRMVVQPSLKIHICVSILPENCMNQEAVRSPTSWMARWPKTNQIFIFHGAKS
jgi:hypothetical protein